jgi:homoserine dehydrogenase
VRHSPVIVLKFGSSVLRCEADLPRAVHEIYRWLRAGYRVIAVVSAFGDTTDRLLRQAEEYGAEPEAAALAALVATGEATSAALLALALDRAGIHGVPLDADRIGLRTTGRRLNAKPAGLDVAGIRRVLDEFAVAVVPGFVGRTREGGTSLLGRGGSDLTALFVAQQLFAERCRLIKDVAGVYEHDPAAGNAPRRYAALNFTDALALHAQIVQPKALRFAQQHHLRFEIAGLNADDATLIGSEHSVWAAPPRHVRPLRIGLLGLGTVGLGVYRELAARPEQFEITRVAVRNFDRDDGVPRALLTRDVFEAVHSDCDVVIELIGGLEPAGEAIAAALAAGKHVVTANKSVLAQRGAEFAAIAASAGARLLYSAAVGGAVPVLETLTQLARATQVRSVEAVINGTCNFVLDELARGCSFEDAVALAQASGFAEADPTFDLDGSDVACKLVLIAQAAFGVELPFEAIERRGIGDLDPRHVFDLNASARAVRLVARLRRTEHGIEARVEPAVLEATHAFASAQREQNCVIVELADSSRVTLRGKGAGRWPTTEAVFADVLDLQREHARGELLVSDKTNLNLPAVAAAAALRSAS